MRRLCLAAAAAFALDLARRYRAFPDVVASHFALNGAANGLMTKPVFFGFFAVIGLIVLVYALFPARLLPARAARAPSVEAFERHCAVEGLWTMIFLTILVELLADANLRRGGSLDNAAFIPVLFGFIALILGLRWRFWRSTPR